MAARSAIAPGVSVRLRASPWRRAFVLKVVPRLRCLRWHEGGTYNRPVRKPVVLITGAGGEIGHGLIDQLVKSRERGIVTLDVNRLDAGIAKSVDVEITGSILEKGILDRILATYKVELVFHLAALLSTRSEFTPVTAH